VGRHANAEWIVNELKRAVHNAPTVKALWEALSAAKPGERPDGYKRLSNQTLPAMARIVERVVYAYSAAQRDTEDAGTFTAAQLDAVTRHYREVLDLAPLSKPARLTFRPLWPMTLAQLRAQVADLPQEEPRTNPAPLILRDRAPQKQYPNFAVGKALAARSSVDTRAAGVDPQTQRDYRALAGIAWNLSAPEGFPPYPRRGGVYSDNEGSAIDIWLRDEWPVQREVDRLAEQKDAERAEAGIPATALRELIEGLHSGPMSFREYVREYTQKGILPSADDKTPRDYHTAILQWARRHLFPTLDALDDFDVALLQRQADPDAHMRALADNQITRYAVTNAAERLYGLARHQQEWTKALTGRDRTDKPGALLAAYPEREGTAFRRVFPLSVLLAAQARNDAAYHAREARETADAESAKAAALPKLRAMLAAGRAFSRANLQKELPGYTLYTHTGTRTASVHLRAPGGGNIAYGQGSTITGAMARLQAALGL
jgi:hypothetical protein